MTERFEDVARELLGEPGVTEGSGFGKSPGLRVNDKIFAMLVGGRLVVKLPRERCEELVGQQANYLQMGKRQMREWISVDDGDWTALSREALDYVRAVSANPR